jgi:hypothetical protein
MSLGDILLNLLFAFLAFFIVRYIGTMVVPDGADKDKIVNIVGLLVGVVVFFANFAAQLIK